MSVINFMQRLAELEAAAARSEATLNRLENTINNVRGPMDELIETAERTGSAVGDVNGVMIEAVRMSGEVVPVLQGVMWEMYRVREELEEQEKVSTDILDKMAGKMDAFVPQFDLWTKHWLALAANGKMSLEELEKTIEDWFRSPGIIQMNTMLGGDINGFILAFRRLMKEITDGAAEVKEAFSPPPGTTSTMGGNGNGGGMGASNTAVTSIGMSKAINRATRRTL